MVNVNAAVLCKSGFHVLCPILAITVALENGSEVKTYGMLDSGTNKWAVLKSFITKNRIATIDTFMKLSTLNSEITKAGEACQLTLKSVVDPNFTVQDFEFFVAHSRRKADSFHGQCRQQ